VSDDAKIRQIALARVLLDDIALGRLASQPLLIKARRLARMAQAHETIKWLGWELTGYSGESDLEIRYMDRTGRFIDKRTWTFYSRPLAELDGKIGTVEAELRAVQNAHRDSCGARPASEVGSKLSAMNGGSSLAPVSPALIAELSLTQEVGRIMAIRSRVTSMLHEFVGSMYCTTVFRRLVETIFEKHQAWADTLLHTGVGDAIEEIPQIYQRLSAADREALIHALERVWNCQPLAWKPRRQTSEFAGGLEIVPETALPQANAEEILLQFNRVVRELLRGKMSRNTARRSKEDLLLGIRNSARENLVYRPQKAVARPVEKSARLA